MTNRLQGIKTKLAIATKDEPFAHAIQAVGVSNGDVAWLLSKVETLQDTLGLLCKAACETTNQSEVHPQHKYGDAPTTIAEVPARVIEMLAAAANATYDAHFMDFPCPGDLEALVAADRAELSRRIAELETGGQALHHLAEVLNVERNTARVELERLREQRDDLAATLRGIARFGEGVTHGWATSVRHKANQALLDARLPGAVDSTLPTLDAKDHLP